MRARTARIAAAVVFVAGASLAVAGMAAAEEPDRCATNPFASGCELDLGIGPSASGSPEQEGLLPVPDTGTETTAEDGRNNNGGGKDDEPSSGTPSTTSPATGTTSSQPPATGTTPPVTGPPATTPPSTTPPASPPATTPGQQCDIARGGVDCGTAAKSPSAPSGEGGGGPQRNYGGGSTPSAGAAAAGSTGTTAGAGTELANTGQGANLAFVVVGGSAMAAGGFAFTVLPGRLNRRGAGTATA
ncbi:hypothetical protein [Streptodolium elevatio]